MVVGGAETPLGALLGIIRSVVLGSDSLAGPKCRADWFWGVLSQGRWGGSASCPPHQLRWC